MKYIVILFICLIFLSCNSNSTNYNDGAESKKEVGESEDINQQPSLPETNKPLPVTVELEAKDFVFLPPDVILEPGTEALFIITNNGDHQHKIHFDLPEGEIELDSAIRPGQTDSIEINVPQEPGEYAFYCPRENHREMAMKGRILVREDH